MKENDFIVAGINNPDYNYNMLKASGLNTTNTQLLSKEDYLQSDFIKNNELFKDSSGEFSEIKFDEYYNERLKEWKQFSANEQEFAYDMFDFRRFQDENAKVKSPNIQLFKQVNPLEKTIGSGYINESIDSPFSVSELAQKNAIYDSESGTFKEYSPNDHNLLSNPLAWFQDIFEEPLVLATYDQDEDEINPITGQTEHHKKGDKKVNSDGKFYYETLNGRSLSDKKILSGWDTLTIDGSALNTIDFFDSDDKDKSIGGTLMKTAAAIAPLFIPGPTGLIYGGLMVGRELMKSLPIIDGIFGAIGNSDTPFTKMANNLAGKGIAATQQVSQYSQDNMITFENLANLMTDVALQWAQQKAIAEAISSLSGTKTMMKSAEDGAKKLFDKASVVYKESALKEVSDLRNAGKLTQAAEREAEINNTLLKIIGDGTGDWKNTDMGRTFLAKAQGDMAEQITKINNIAARSSLWYMNLVSNTDLYAESLDAGLTKREALAVTLGSMIGMNIVDNTELGTQFFDNIVSGNTQSIRATLSNSRKKWVQGLIAERNILDKTPKNKLSKLFNKGIDKGKDILNKYWDDVVNHTGGFVVKAISEGLEEVGEELASDISKQLFTWASEIKPVSNLFGGLTQADLKPFDNIGSDPNGMVSLIQRYGMNFAGGVLGGGLFYGVDYFKGNITKRNPDKDQLIYLVNNNQTNKTLAILDNLHKKGKLGSTQLSTEIEKDSEGNYYFLSADSNRISQNDFIYNQLKQEIISLDKIINDDNLAISDESFYRNITAGEIRFRKLEEILKENGSQLDYQVGLVDRYQNLLSQYISNKEELEQYDKLHPVVDGNIEGQKKRQEEKAKLQEKVNQQLKELQAFKSGEAAIDYAGQTMFIMDSRVSEPFYHSTFKTFLKNQKQLNIAEFDNLDDIQKQELLDSYDEYVKKEQKLDANVAWQQFKELREELSPIFKDSSEKAKQYEEFQKKLNELFDQDLNPMNNRKQYTLDQINVVPDEDKDDELNISYDEVLRGESEEKYLTRYKQDTENEADYQKRYNARVNELKKQRLYDLYERENIKALDKIREIIENSGGFLDSNTKRHLLLQIGRRKKDIVQYNVEKYINTSPIIDEIKQILATGLLQNENLENTSVLINNAYNDYTKFYVNNIINNADAYVYFSKLAESLGIDIDKTTGLTQKNIGDIFNKENDRRQNLRNRLAPYITSSGNTYTFNNSKINEDLKALGKPEVTINSDNIKDTLKQLGFSSDELYGINKTNLKSWVDINLSDISLSQKSEARTKFIQNNSTIDGYDVDSNIAVQALDKANELFGDDLDKISEYLWNNVLSYNGESFNDLGNIQVDESGLSESYFLEVDDELITGSIERANTGDSKKRNSAVLAGKLKTIKESVERVVSESKNDSVYRYIEDISKAKPLDNPILDFVKKLSIHFGLDNTNVEDLLTDLTALVNKVGSSEFKLDELQRKALDEAEQKLKLLKSFVIASFDSKNIANPYPHNQLLNQMAGKELFPVIDDKVGNLILGSINSILHQIGVQSGKNDNPYNYGSIRYWDTENAFNKINLFLKTDKMFTETKLQFFKTYGDDFKGNIGGEDFDLLSGLDDISSDSDIALHQFEDTFNHNINKLLAKGFSFKQILESCISLRAMYMNKDSEIKEQIVSNIHPKMKLSDLSVMDKILYMATVAGINSSDFNLYLSKNNSDKIPFSAQEYVTRMALAYKRQPNILGSALEFLHGLANYSPDLDHAIIQALFISGNGGAGKSDVIVRNIINDYSEDEKKNIALLGPTKQQEDSLSKISPTSKHYSGDSIFNDIMDNYDIIIQESAKNPSEWTHLDKHKYALTKSEKYIATLKEGSIKFKDAGLKAIIVDEATHFSTLQLSILAAYCKEKNIPFLVCGDPYQQGYREGLHNLNLNQECILVARSPRLAITFRDASIQKQQIVDTLVNTLSNLTNIQDNDRKDILAKKYLEEARNIEIPYYYGSEIYGDYFTSEITTSDIDRLGNVESIGVLSNTSTSNLIEQLKNKYGEDKVHVFTDEVALQGQEFSTIIVDTDWTIPKSNGNYDEQRGNMLTFLRRYYTLSTRGKNSAIFIDKDEKLREFFKQKRQSYKNTISGLNDEGKARYKTYKLNILEKLKPYSNTSESSTENTKPENDTTDSTIGSGGVAKKSEIPDPYDEKLANDYNKEEDEDELSEIEAIEHIQRKLDSVDAIAYSEFSLRGVIQDSDKHWYASSQEERDKSGFLSDIDIFMEAGQVAYGKDSYDVLKQNFLVKQLMTLKSQILFQHYISPGIISDWTDDLDFDNKEFGIEVSKKDSSKDRLIGYSTLKESGMEIDGGDSSKEPLLYKLVVKIPIKKTRKLESKFKDSTKYVKITLGALGNVQTYKDGITDLQALRKSLEDRIAQLRKKQSEVSILSKKEARELDRKIKRIQLINDWLGSDNRESKINEYESLFNQLYNGYKSQSNPVYFMHVDDIVYTKTTEIIDGLTGKFANGILRLSDFMSEGLQGKLTTNFNQYNPYLVKSPIYIVSEKLMDSEDKTGIGGKAVIFVSKDMCLSPENLISEYSRQKDIPDSQRTVRMLHLDNLGVSYSQLCDSRVYGKEFRTFKPGEENYNKFPQETDYLGIRQLIALHNYRAELIQFKQNHFDNTTKQTIFGTQDNKIINQILAELHDAYHQYLQSLSSDINEARKLATEEKFREFYRQNGKYKDIAERVWDFNDNLGKSIKSLPSGDIDWGTRQFRLGIGNETEVEVFNSKNTTVKQNKRNGFQIRKMQVNSNNAFYSEIKDDVYGIYLTPEEIDKQLEILELLFDRISPEFKLSKNDGQPYKADQFIDFDQNGSPSGFVTLLRNSTPEGNPLDVNIVTNTNDPRPSKLIHHLPNILSKIGKRAIAYSKTYEKPDKSRWLPFPDDNLQRRPFQKKRTDEEQWDWVKSQSVKFTSHEGNENIEHIINVQSLVEYGEDIVKLLDLVFHGTTDEFIEKQTKGDFTPQSSFTPFRYGFLVDPFAFVHDNPIRLGNRVLYACDTNPALLGIKSRINSPRIGIILKSNTEEEPETKHESKPITELEKINQIPNIDNVVAEIRHDGLPKLKQNILDKLSEQVGIKLTDIDEIEFTTRGDFVIDASYITSDGSTKYILTINLGKDNITFNDVQVKTIATTQINTFLQDFKDIATDDIDSKLIDIIIGDYSGEIQIYETLENEGILSLKEYFQYQDINKDAIIEYFETISSVASEFNNMDIQTYIEDDTVDIEQRIINIIDKISIKLNDLDSNVDENAYCSIN